MILRIKFYNLFYFNFYKVISISSFVDRDKDNEKLKENKGECRDKDKDNEKLKENKGECRDKDKWRRKTKNSIPKEEQKLHHLKSTCHLITESVTISRGGSK